MNGRKQQKRRLEDYDSDNRYKALYTLAKSIITYVAMERCDINPETWFAPEDFTVLYGLRRSEVLGLKWDSIDFENKLVREKVSESA